MAVVQAPPVNGEVYTKPVIKEVKEDKKKPVKK